MSDDWIKHDGSDRPPVALETLVRVKLRCGYRSHGAHMAHHILVWPRVAEYQVVE